jgi:hypothetical protein
LALRVLVEGTPKLTGTVEAELELDELDDAHFKSKLVLVGVLELLATQGARVVRVESTRAGKDSPLAIRLNVT